MKTVRMEITENAGGRADYEKIDATTDAILAEQKQEDNDEAMLDAARYVRRIRKRLALTQEEFSRRIDVPLDTIRNWEQGKRQPAGPARALLRILARNPEAASILER